MSAITPLETFEALGKTFELDQRCSSDAAFDVLRMMAAKKRKQNSLDTIREIDDGEWDHVSDKQRRELRKHAMDSFVTPVKDDFYTLYGYARTREGMAHLLFKVCTGIESLEYAKNVVQFLASKNKHAQVLLQVMSAGGLLGPAKNSDGPASKESQPDSLQKTG